MYASPKSALGLRFLSLTVLCFPILVETNQAEPMPETVRIMSFNLWHGGDAGKQPLEQTIEVIKNAKADVVGLQETSGLRPKVRHVLTARPNLLSDSVGFTSIKGSEPGLSADTQSSKLLGRNWARNWHYRQAGNSICSTSIWHTRRTSRTSS